MTLGCIGALLIFLNKLEDDEPNVMDGAHFTTASPWDIQYIKTFHLDDYMLIHQYDLDALSIFDNRPSKIKSPSSIFELLNHTRSSDGKWLLRKWLLRPLANQGMIEYRASAVEFLLLPQHAPLILQLQQSLRKIRSLPTIFRKPRLDINDWNSLFKFTRTVPKMQESLLSVHPQNIPFLDALLQCIDLPLLHKLFQMMLDIIDFEASFAQKSCIVKSGVHAQLDEIKRLDAGLSVLLTKVASELSLHQDAIFRSHFTVLYFPQLGYLISLPLDLFQAHSHAIKELEYQFSSPSNAFFKNAKMKELDEELGDVRGTIVDLEIEIFQELFDQVKAFKTFLLDLHQKITEFDCLISMAEAARKNRFVRPTLVPEPIFQVKNSRHPLLEHYTQPFISNDIQMHQDCIQIITGPNASGKSAYLKTVGLITFLAQIGSFVPADQAVIGITEKLFTRMITKESAARMESAFLIDLQQLSHAINQLTKSSLVLIDEFGKGTELSNGLGLISAVLSHFTRFANGTAGPRVFLATHFHELYSYNLLENSPCISHLKTQVVQDAEHDLVFLYKVIKGKSTDFLGAYCAIQAGMPRSIVKRSIYVAEAFAKGIPIQSEPHPQLDFLPTITPIIDNFLNESDPYEPKYQAHISQTMKSIQ